MAIFITAATLAMIKRRYFAHRECFDDRGPAGNRGLCNVTADAVIKRSFSGHTEALKHFGSGTNSSRQLTRPAG
jgi:hypothetical protein